MKIKNFKRKCLISSLVLLIIGSAIALSGFGLTGFSARSYEEADGHRWYQTIYLENGAWTYGVQVSDSVNILKVGGSPFSLGLYIED